ncbi:MAG: 50S ribosomal protein L18 [Cryomorphaceae bacterium]|jgi:large subunit ribosomal protein L18|nr:50S ribosomal protein L18 [Cryomorphaceae bacterium]
MAITKLQRRNRIRMRIRKHVSGTPEMPRLSVYRSNKAIYAQLIDDLNGKTIVGVSSLNELKDAKGNKVEQANELGKILAAKALENNISTCRFDRGGYLYHGRVKALAEGAREGGLKF